MNIPILTFGSAKQPKVVIISTIHGDEIAGFLLVKKLLPQLTTLAKNLHIRLACLPVANPEGLKAVSRHQPQTKLDLNRCFNLPQPPPEVALIKHIVHGAVLVIDLHTFPHTRHAFTALLFTDPKFPKTSAINLRLTRLLRPQFIWHLDFASVDKEKVGSMGQWITSQNIPNLAIETDPPEFWPPGLANNICHRLSFLIQNFITSTPHRSLPLVDISSRMLIFPPHEGVFIPCVKPLQQIRRTHVIGYLLNFDLSSQAIKTQVAGSVIFIRNPGFVSPNTKLLGISVVEKNI